MPKSAICSRSPITISGSAGTADQLVGVDVHQVDVEMVDAFGVGQAEIEADCWC